jgi:hypothetical protein
VTSAEKTKYRKTVEWKRFRKSVIKSNCELCGGKSKRMNLHHKDPAHYDKLEPELFATLGGVCHRFVEHLAKKKHLPPEFEGLLYRYFV